MRNLIALALVGVLFSTAVAQEEGDEALPRLDEPAASAPASGSAFIIVCDANPAQLLVLDSNGKWLSTVRSAEVSFKIGDATPTVKCTMWSGPFKPTNPEVKTWTLAQLKSVTAAEFQQMVDSLQTDPEAIRRRLTGGGGDASSDTAESGN